MTDEILTINEELINIPSVLNQDYGVMPRATPVDCVGNCLPAMSQGCAGNMACVGTCQPSTQCGSTCIPNVSQSGTCQPANMCASTCIPAYQCGAC